MTYTTRITITRPNEDAQFGQMGPAGAAASNAAMTENGIVANMEYSPDGLQLKVTYSCPDEEAWAAYQTAIAPYMQSAEAQAHREENGLTFTKEVLENS